MTSGRANQDEWVLEFSSRAPHLVDPLTGNVRMVDTREQLDLKFDKLEDAVSYAKANNIPHRVVDTQRPKRIPRSYSENFAYDRKLPWTH